MSLQGRHLQVLFRLRRKGATLTPALLGSPSGSQPVSPQQLS